MFLYYINLMKKPEDSNRDLWLPKLFLGHVFDKLWKALNAPKYRYDYSENVAQYVFLKFK